MGPGRAASDGGGSPTSESDGCSSARGPPPGPRGPQSPSRRPPRRPPWPPWAAGRVCLGLPAGPHAPLTLKAVELAPRSSQRCHCEKKITRLMDRKNGVGAPSQGEQRTFATHAPQSRPQHRLFYCKTAPRAPASPAGIDDALPGSSATRFPVQRPFSCVE